MRKRSSLLFLARTGLGLAAWAAAIAGCLSVRSWPGDWGHGLCGPWGCGPPLQALVACHSAWLMFLLPPAVVLSRLQRPGPTSLRKTGALLACVAIAVLGGIALRQRLDLWSAATQSQQEYFWQRCGFVVATTVDLPVVQMLITGMFLSITPRRASLRSLESIDPQHADREEATSTETH